MDTRHLISVSVLAAVLLVACGGENRADDIVSPSAPAATSVATSTEVTEDRMAVAGEAIESLPLVVSGMAIDAGVLWASNGDDGTLTAVDVRSSPVIGATISIGTPRPRPTNAGETIAYSCPRELVVAHDRVWALLVGDGAVIPVSVGEWPSFGY
jgi:hypothetical protein